MRLFRSLRLPRVEWLISLIFRQGVWRCRNCGICWSSNCQLGCRFQKDRKNWQNTSCLWPSSRIWVYRRWWRCSWCQSIELCAQKKRLYLAAVNRSKLCTSAINVDAFDQQQILKPNFWIVIFKEFWNIPNAIKINNVRTNLGNFAIGSKKLLG